MIEHDAIAIAKLTPTAGWGDAHVTDWHRDGTLFVRVVPRPDPATVKLALSKAELVVRIRRAWRQLIEHSPGNRQQAGETAQQWADRLGAHPLFHTIRVAYINLEALS